MDKSLPANAGDRGLIPDLGRFHTPQSSKAHATQLLSPRALEPALHNKESRRSERPMRRDWGAAPPTTREEPHSNEDQHSRK